MAAITILFFVLSLSIGFGLYMITTPIVTEVRYNNHMWDDMPTNVLALGDQIHGIWLLFILVIVGMVVLMAYQRASNARATTQ